MTYTYSEHYGKQYIYRSNGSKLSHIGEFKSEQDAARVCALLEQDDRLCSEITPSQTPEPELAEEEI